MQSLKANEKLSPQSGGYRSGVLLAVLLALPLPATALEFEEQSADVTLHFAIPLDRIRVAISSPHVSLHLKAPAASRQRTSSPFNKQIGVSRRGRELISADYSGGEVEWRLLGKNSFPQMILLDGSNASDRSMPGDNHRETTES